MAKLTLNTIGSRYGSIDALNDNFDAIEAAIENTLSLDGTSPNALEADLDMNSNSILNAATIHASSLVIGGQTLEPGSAVAAATVQVFEFTATAGQTSFSVSPLTPTSSSVLMEVNGLSLPTSSLVTSGSTLSFPALTLGDEAVVKVLTRVVGSSPIITNADVAASAAIVSSKLAFTQAGTGTQVRTVQDKMREGVSVKDFGAVGDGGVDDTTAIQAAINYAHSLSLGNITVPYDTIRKGGTTVYLPPGTYKITTTLELKENVVLQGAGRFSTIITSTYDGTLIRNQTPLFYDAFGMGIKDLCVQGERTKTSQIGIALLRDWQGTYSNVSVVECGSHGWRVYQCILTQFDNIEALECIGNGFMVTDGIGSWAAPTASNLPTNGLKITNIHTYGCNGAGIYLGRIGSGTGVMGCQFFGGSSEYNYAASASGVGYNIEIVNTASAVPNCFYSIWCEDTRALAHVYINAADAQENIRFVNFNHFANGAASWPQKAMIVVKGKLLLDSPVGSGTAYRTYLGSNAPFQLTKATGSIFATNILGSTLTPTQAQIVDETGALSGLETNIKVNNYGNIWGGPWNFNTDFGQTGPTFTQAGQAHPYVKLENFYKGVMFGDGTATADAGLYRVSANVLAPMSGDSFQVGGINGETLKYNAGTANAAVATTLGSVGPTGSTAGNPQGWLRVNVAGTDRFVPYW